MRELPLSNSEKKFVTTAASESKRLDGRKLEEFRQFDIHFGREWGSCLVTLGETKALANVSCDVQEPQAVRPNEGLLFINVEVTAMAAPHLAGATRSDLGVHLNRMLEKCIKESKAVDLEALCIVADEKVWALRVDVNVINHEGNLLDCCSLAALAALAHFKRPDVTMDGTEVIIHDPTERDAIPITLHHYPICVSFAYFSEKDVILSDPTAIEERVSDASLILGVNSYRELCALFLGGSAVVAPKVIMRCATHAALRAKQTVEQLKSKIAQDLKEREVKNPVGFASCCATDKITALAVDRIKIQLGKFRLHTAGTADEEMVVDEPERETNDMIVNQIKDESDENKAKVEIVDLGENTAELVDVSPKKATVVSQVKFGEGGPSQWFVEIASPPLPGPTQINKKSVCKERKNSSRLDEDSDEEQVHVLDAKLLDSAERVITQPIAKTRKRKQKKNS